MTDETKQLFDAPWKPDERYCEVRNETGYLVCSCAPTEQEMRNRIARLPELYDAMEEAAHVICLRCLANSGTLPPNLAHFKKHCGFDDDCKYCTTKNYWKLLRKVRDGK